MKQLSSPFTMTRSLREDELVRDSKWFRCGLYQCQKWIDNWLLNIIPNAIHSMCSVVQSLSCDFARPRSLHIILLDFFFFLIYFIVCFFEWTLLRGSMGWPFSEYIFIVIWFALLLSCVPPTEGQKPLFACYQLNLYMTEIGPCRCSTSSAKRKKSAEYSFIAM